MWCAAVDCVGRAICYPATAIMISDAKRAGRGSDDNDERRIGQSGDMFGRTSLGASSATGLTSSTGLSVFSVDDMVADCVVVGVFAE